MKFLILSGEVTMSFTWKAIMTARHDHRFQTGFFITMVDSNSVIRIDRCGHFITYKKGQRRSCLTAKCNILQNEIPILING